MPAFIETVVCVGTCVGGRGDMDVSQAVTKATGLNCQCRFEEESTGPQQN